MKEYKIVTPSELEAQCRVVLVGQHGETHRFDGFAQRFFSDTLDAHMQRSRFVDFFIVRLAIDMLTHALLTNARSTDRFHIRYIDDDEIDTIAARYVMAYPKRQDFVMRMA